jgi:hypothetical protein
MDDHSTIEDALHFLNRIRDEAQRLGVITLTPFEFCAALRLGAIQYIADVRGSSIGGQAVAEFSPRLENARVAVNVAK